MNKKENSCIEEIDKIWNDIDNILKIPNDNDIKKVTCFIKIKRYLKLFFKYK